METKTKGKGCNGGMQGFEMAGEKEGGTCKRSQEYEVLLRMGLKDVKSRLDAQKPAGRGVPVNTAIGDVNVFCVPSTYRNRVEELLSNHHETGKTFSMQQGGVKKGKLVR